MTKDAARVLKQALELSDDARAELAAGLLASLGPAVPEREDREWIAEVERRAREALGGASGIPWDQVRRRAEDRLRDK